MDLEAIAPGSGGLGGHGAVLRGCVPAGTAPLSLPPGMLSAAPRGLAWRSGGELNPTGTGYGSLPANPSRPASAPNKMQTPLQPGSGVFLCGRRDGDVSAGGGLAAAALGCFSRPAQCRSDSRRLALMGSEIGGERASLPGNVKDWPAVFL